MRLHDLFADILDPPKPFLSQQVTECVFLLSSRQQEAAGLMNQFRTVLDQTPLSQMGEIYAGTFGPEAICYPYVGYHLFGDGSQRRMFLAGLEEQYQIYHFSAADEVPDHLGIMLRFLATIGDEEEKEEMTFLYVLPAMKRMLRGFVDRRTPYKGVLQALSLVLREEQETQSDQIPEGREVPKFPYSR
ncbi:MAG TPA: molecular chaperone TorD family protein [Thermodesulfobacteriota bacterium]|nr:molecular chaperone TorD family protein [Thermodesulfobacteriota bacterium]